MSDNVIKSTDVTSAKEESNPVKKAPAKKAAAKPKEVKEKAVAQNLKVVIFECGASYVSGDISFTREDNIKEVPEDQADFLLTLENFRVPNQIELEEFYNSKED